MRVRDSLDLMITACLCLCFAFHACAGPQAGKATAAFLSWARPAAKLNDTPADTSVKTDCTTESSDGLLLVLVDPFYITHFFALFGCTYTLSLSPPSLSSV